MNSVRIYIHTLYKAVKLCLLLGLFSYVIVPGDGFSQEEDLHIITGEGNAIWMKYTDAPNALYHHLMLESFQLLDQREQIITELTSRRDWERRQKEVRNTLMNIVGPFPERTPLNPQVTGTIHKDGYTLEKVVFESRPDFYVTAGLFLPDNRRGRTPAILQTPGHSAEGFRTSQQIILSLVSKGFIVLAIDPIGQGERLQYYDPKTGVSRIGGPTSEHSYPGAQCFLSGSSMARYEIWDGIRAIDYLVSRPEVDANRIGIHGVSGGGTQSAYIAAFDDRVLAAAPSNYITSFRRLLESIGPQDAEQNFYHGLAEGIDHADLLEVRAPKPALVMATTRDFFSIQGVRETAREVRMVYEAFGKPENFETVEDDLGHGTTVKTREAMYAFFQKHLSLPGDPKDEQVKRLSTEELRITKTGQVSTSLGGETVFSLNAREVAEKLRNLSESRRNIKGHVSSVKKMSRELTGYIPPEIMGDPVFAGRYQRDGYDVEMYFVSGEGEYVIPYLLILPDAPGPHPALLYLHPGGKIAEAGVNEEMEWFVKQGYVVLAPDLIGTGEIGPGRFRGDAYIQGISLNIWFLSILNGRSIVGIQAGDVIRLVDVLRNNPHVSTDRIDAMARGESGAALLHAGLFESAFRKIALVDPLLSYRSLVENEYYRTSYIFTAPANVLPHYDLPDIMAGLAPRPLLLVNLVDQNGHAVNQQLIDSELGVVKRAYRDQGKEDLFRIKRWERYQSRDDIFADW